MVACLAAGPVWAEGTRVSVETGPLDLALGGLGAGAAVTPSSSPHWRVGSTAYRLELPKFITELDSANVGWTATLTFGIDINVSYQVAESGKGWFFEGIVPYERYRYEHDGMSTTAANLSLTVGAGYKWMPFDNGLFVRPLLGVAVRLASTGSRSVGGKEFADPLVKPLPVIHVGYEF
ncbi:MAG TPA: hypothetical protein VFQ53_25455 [Kofleriaceae bacterium]|nr:hypothetical protein [Kofleriaceae bacterium]